MQVNGEQADLVRPMSLGAFLSDMEIGASRIVVERNGEIVARDSYDTTMLSAGDVLEILYFVGGG